MIEIEGICYIFGSFGKSSDIPKLNLKNKDIIIAADGGYDIANLSQNKCDILIGDFDSIKNDVDFENKIIYPVEKDETDSFLAYKTGFDMGYRKFVVFGGIGGRLDHTVANLQMLNNMSKNGARGFLVGEGSIACSISDSQIYFSENNSGKIGVFAQDETAFGVTISGLKYNLNSGALTPQFPLGVSNEFINKNAFVKAENGTLLIIWYESAEVFLKNIDIYTKGVRN